MDAVDALYDSGVAFDKILNLQKRRQKQVETPYFQSNIKKRLKAFLNTTFLPRPFRKDMEERFFVLKNEHVPGREEPTKVVQIFEVHKTTRKTLFEKGPKAQFKLENLYFNEKKERYEERSSAQAMWCQLTLYYRGESTQFFVDTLTQEQLNLQKMVLYFRSDDQLKRNKWADDIQRYRLEIKAEIEAEVQRGKTDQERSNVPYYVITHEDRRSFYPEVVYVDFQVTHFCQNRAPAQLADCKCVPLPFKGHIQERIRQYTKELTEDKTYHLLITEEQRQSMNPALQLLKSNALHYKLELIRVDGESSKFAIESTEYEGSGPFDGLNLLYGFKLHSERFESGFTARQKKKQFALRYEITFRFPDDQMLTKFKRKIDNLRKVNDQNLSKKSNPEFRMRTHTAPPRAAPDKPTDGATTATSRHPRTSKTKNNRSPEQKKSIELSPFSDYKGEAVTTSRARYRTTSDDFPSTTTTTEFQHDKEVIMEESEAEPSLYQNQKRRNVDDEPISTSNDIDELISRHQDDEQGD